MFHLRTIQRTLGFLLAPLLALALTACDDSSTGPDGTATLNLSSQPDADIPDNDPAGISDDIDISEGGTVQDVTVDLEVSHTYAGHLVIVLQHTDSDTRVELLDTPNEGDADCSGNDPVLTFDDASSNDVQTACDASTGDPAYPESTYSPSENLSEFEGEDVQGTWRLHIADVHSGDIGTLDEWGMAILVEQ